jgi:class 3 adenylate cyclase/tetratricopeptide (TPR) repeat protein
MTASSRVNAISEAERRQLTVMFCDLVDSTALAERLDPEDYREVVGLYQRTCEAVVDRFEGRIAQYLGDGLLVYFGHPVAHEDDARRAVHAGLGILEELEKLSQRLEAERGVKLAARVGVHTGLVVVGDMGGRGRQEQLAVGETPNVASRLQGLAAPGTLVVSAATHRLVQPFFTCQDLGEHAIKGLSAPLRVYRVLEERDAGSGGETVRAGEPTALVGRQREVDLLADQWSHVRQGASRVVLLSGEAGLGKSRLVETVKEHVAGQPHAQLECRCSPYYQSTALYPVIDFLQRRLGWRREHSPAEKLERLEALLAPYEVPLPDVVPLLAALLALPLPEDRYPPLMLSPQRQRTRTLEAIVSVLRAIAVAQPLLFIVEDLHWVDPTTAELIGLLLDQRPEIPLLALLVFRPEFRPPWNGGRDYARIELAALSQDESAALVTRVAGGRRLPEPVLQQLVANTDGNPLFVEELTKMVLESGLLREAGDRYELTAPSLTLAIPTTLHDSLIARLDRLGPAKSVAQLAAVLGRAFPYELLRAMAHVDAATMDDALGQLAGAGLVYQQGARPHALYLFKHALVQEAAYQSLLRSVRQQYHQRVAETLTAQFPETAETQPELVAHHYTEAGLGAQAIPYWQRAGERAVGRSANLEAISHLTKGLSLLAQVPEGPRRLQCELGLQLTLGTPLMATRGYSAQDVEKVFGRALELCRQIGETPQLFNALRGLRQFYQIRGDTRTAYELGEQLLRLAERTQDTGQLIEAHNAVGGALFWMGEYSLAQEHFEQVIQIYDPRKHRAHASLYGNDPGVVGHSYAAWALWYLGHVDRSLRHLEKCIALATELALPFSMASAFAYAAVLHYFRREPGPARERAEQTIAIASEHGFPFWLAMATCLRGWALSELGQHAEAIAHLRQGLAISQALRTDLGRPHYLAMLAQALWRTGQFAEASAALEEALAMVAAHDDRSYDAMDVYHAKGELLLAQGEGHDEEASRHFARALDIARRQGAKSLELRAALGQARLLQRQGRRAEAREPLEAICSWFTEGLDSTEMRAARGLLKTLA